MLLQVAGKGEKKINIIFLIKHKNSQIRKKEIIKKGIKIQITFKEPKEKYEAKSKKLK